MTTVRYARYVVINEESGVVVWSESDNGARKAQKTNGGTLYDLNTDNPFTVEHALQSARHRMGVE